MIHSKFLERFIEYIDHPISLTAMREATAYGRPILVSPLTRRPVLGALTLGSHPSYVDATNRTLMQLMAGGKRLGNPDFWFAVFWLLLEDGRIPYLRDMLPFVREHMLFRLRSSMAHASLTGLPGFVNYSVPLGVACWVSLCSPVFPGIRQRFDTLRLHMQHTRPLFELLKLMKFPVPESIAVYNKRLRVLFTLREMATTKFVHMKAAVRALTQNCCLIRAVPESIRIREKATFSYLVPVDGPADDDQVRLALSMLPKYCREITLREVAGIADLITKPSISLEHILLGVDWEPPELPPPVVDWAHYEGVAIPPVRVCLATMRPFYHVQARGRPLSWMQAFRHMIPNGKIFSVYNLWGLFVNKYNIYPTANALIAFIWARYAANGYARTLPANVRAIVEDCIRAFEPVATFLPREVSRRFLASASVAVLAELERGDPQNPASL
jgi:hypothetical protein